MTAAPHAGDMVQAARLRIRAAVVPMLGAPRAPEVRPPGDNGLFGPHSVTWKVHGDLAMLVGGLRALLLQTLHPLAMAGVAEHSQYRQDPWGRLRRTAAFLRTTTFGSTAAAEAAIASVRAVHERVRGVAPDGRPYSAGDPHLLMWIHVTEVDSFLTAYQRYGGGQLSPAGADGYVAEMGEVARRLGVAEPPTTTDELRAVMDGFRPELRAGRQARDAVRFLLVPPVAWSARPAYGVIAASAVTLLPAWARCKLSFPPLIGADLVVRPTGFALLRTLTWALTAPDDQAAA